MYEKVLLEITHLKEQGSLSRNSDIGHTLMTFLCAYKLVKEKVVALSADFLIFIS